jgi:hypothetical protein
MVAPAVLAPTPATAAALEQAVLAEQATEGPVMADPMVTVAAPALALVALAAAKVHVNSTAKGKGADPEFGPVALLLLQI